MSFADILAAWYTPPFLSGAWGRPILSDLDGNQNVTSQEELNQRSTRLLGNVLSFKIVRYWMASTDTETTLAAEKQFNPTDEKPAWIEFEIVLEDSNNRLAEPFVATYRVNLPSR